MGLYGKFRDLVPKSVCLKSRDNGEFLAVKNLDQELFYLNETARFIYELCDGHRSVDEIYKAMSAEYAFDESEEDVVKADLLHTLRDFQWQKIMELMEVSS